MLTYLRSVPSWEHVSFLRAGARLAFTAVPRSLTQGLEPGGLNKYLLSE